MDAAVMFKPFDDWLDRTARAGDMPTHRISRREHVPIGEIERCHIAVHLRSVYGAADALQRRAHFLGDLIEPVRKDFESDRINARDDWVDRHGLSSQMNSDVAIFVHGGAVHRIDYDRGHG